MKHDYLKYAFDICIAAFFGICAVTLGAWSSMTISDVRQQSTIVIGFQNLVHNQ